MNDYRRAIALGQANARITRLLVWLALIVGAIAFILPLYTMFAMALKTPTEIATTSSWAWPKHPTLENFSSVLTNPNLSFWKFFQNTAFIALISTLGVILSSCSVAYAFARLRFAGRDRLFILLLMTMMLPGVVTLIPTYVLFSKLEWINTYLPLTVPAFFGAAYNIFLLRQFFMTIPRELDEAAVLDGASHWIILTRVIVPNSGPALATVGIFALIWSWRDFMGPLIYLNDPDKQTLEVGLRMFQGINAEQWHLLMAASVLVSIPLIVLFFVGQRYFVRGIVMSGGK